MAFQQGLSGLNAASKGLDVIGNNVANASTVGFKTGSAHFGDVYATSLSATGGGGGGSQVGIGTSVLAIQQQFTQGNTTSTNNPLDIAINGGGFFKLISDNGVSYTRNGQFHTDKAGYIVNDLDYKLMGYEVDASGNVLSGNPKPIHLSEGNVPPLPTGKDATSKAVLNLDSRLSPPTISPFNAADSSSYNYSTPMTVYDSLGNEHVVNFYFVKTATAANQPSVWDMHATFDGANPQTITPALTFDTNGMLTSGMPVNLPQTWAIANGAVSPIGSGLSNWGIDFTGTTHFGGANSVNSMLGGGYGQGALTSISVSPDGVIRGNYSNGQSRNLAQVVLTTFANPNGLINLGNNQYQGTSASGDALDGVPQSGTRGVLKSLSVEEANVDLTAELVNMITMQRNYQANAQTIKTQDQIMQTLVNLR